MTGNTTTQGPVKPELLNHLKDDLMIREAAFSFVSMHTVMSLRQILLIFEQQS